MLREQILAWLVDTSDVIPPVRDPRIEPSLVEQFIGSARSDYRLSRS